LLTGSLPGAVPSVHQPNGYQIVSAGKDGQSTAAGRNRNEIHIESLSWTTANAAPAESVTIVSERIQRVSASTDAGVVGDLNEFQQGEIDR
jgi:hypothetical protein